MNNKSKYYKSKTIQNLNFKTYTIICGVITTTSAFLMSALTGASVRSALHRLITFHRLER